MKRKRFTEEQIIGVLKEAAAGAKTLDLCRRHGLSEQTFYRWKAKYRGLEVAEVRGLSQLEDENGRLKRLVANLTLDNQALKGLPRKKLLTPAAQRNAARAARTEYGLRERRSCALVGLRRSTCRYRPAAPFGRAAARAVPRRDPAAARRDWLNLPRFGRHPRSHESAVGVCRGKRKRPRGRRRAPSSSITSISSTMGSGGIRRSGFSVP